jgi:hypothetical protein
MGILQSILENSGWRDAIDAAESEVVQAIQAAGGKGKITITLDYEAAGMSKDGTVRQIETSMAEPSVKLPRKSMGSVLNYLTEDGELSKVDPRQDDLPGLRSITEPAEAPAPGRRAANA